MLLWIALEYERQLISISLDESGISFKNMIGRSNRKGIGERNLRLYKKVSKGKGNLNRMTVMAVVNADGQSIKLVVVIPEKQAHYRRLGNGSLRLSMTIFRIVTFSIVTLLVLAVPFSTPGPSSLLQRPKTCVEMGRNCCLCMMATHAIYNPTSSFGLYKPGSSPSCYRPAFPTFYRQWKFLSSVPSSPTCRGVSKI